MSWWNFENTDLSHTWDINRIGCIFLYPAGILAKCRHSTQTHVHTHIYTHTYRHTQTHTHTHMAIAQAFKIWRSHPSDASSCPPLLPHPPHFTPSALGCPHHKLTRGASTGSPPRPQALHFYPTLSNNKPKRHLCPNCLWCVVCSGSSNTVAALAPFLFEVRPSSFDVS